MEEVGRQRTWTAAHRSATLGRQVLPAAPHRPAGLCRGLAGRSRNDPWRTKRSPEAVSSPLASTCCTGLIPVAGGHPFHRRRRYPFACTLPVAPRSLARRLGSVVGAHVQPSRCSCAWIHSSEWGARPCSRKPRGLLESRAPRGPRGQARAGPIRMRRPVPVLVSRGAYRDMGVSGAAFCVASCAGPISTREGMEHETDHRRCQPATRLPPGGSFWARCRRPGSRSVRRLLRL